MMRCLVSLSMLVSMCTAQCSPGTFWPPGQGPFWGYCYPCGNGQYQNSPNSQGCIPVPTNAIGIAIEHWDCYNHGTACTSYRCNANYYSSSNECNYIGNRGAKCVEAKPCDDWSCLEEFGPKRPDLSFRCNLRCEFGGEYGVYAESGNYWRGDDRWYTNDDCVSMGNRVCTEVWQDSVDKFGVLNSVGYYCNRAVSCGEICQRGSYASTPCGANTPRSCSPCPVGTCRPCPNGEYTDAEGSTVCNQCTNCAVDWYQSAPCTATTNTQCSECTSSCVGAMESIPCTQTTNRECVACATCESRGQPGSYWTTPCTGSASPTCQTCSLCGANEYETKSCSTDQNRECASCDPATCAAETYQTTPCTARSNRVCTACATCAADTYEIVRCGSRNRECSACTLCGVEEYEVSPCTATSNRVCALCTTCTGGSYSTTPCSQTTNRVCSQCTSCSGRSYDTTSCASCQENNDYVTSCSPNGVVFSDEYEPGYNYAYQRRSTEESCLPGYLEQEAWIDMVQDTCIVVRDNAGVKRRINCDFSIPTPWRDNYQVSTVPKYPMVYINTHLDIPI
jgi:hypothetical protein